MWRVRPAKADDLSSLLHLVCSRSRGLSSTLPRESHALAERIALSERAFADELAADDHARYLFVLVECGSGQHDGKIAGVSAIDAHAGNGEPFYSYRRDGLIHASRELGISRRVEMLFPAHAITNRSLLGGFAIDADLVGGEAFQLLSRARMLFIADHRERFADEIAVEIQGLQGPDGKVPFWDSLGRHFFNMDFATADAYSNKLSKTFIAELMPSNPVYVSLLSAAAQAAIGQAHHAAEAACKLLKSEGFDISAYVDIFDAGPVLEAKTDELATLQNSAVDRMRDDDGGGDSGALHLIAAGRGSAFRAALAPASRMADGRLSISAHSRQLLNCKVDDRLRSIPVNVSMNGEAAC